MELPATPETAPWVAGFVAAICGGMMGLGWIACYLLIIRRARLDKAYGMPYLALCFNITWEAMLLFQLAAGEALWVLVLAWFLLDCVMLAQYFRYAERGAPSSLRAKLFLPAALALLAVALGTNLAAAWQFEDDSGGVTAYPVNAIVSIAFCGLVLRRDSLAGQSIYIAIAKFAGTAGALAYAPLLHVAGITDAPASSSFLKYPFIAWSCALVVVFDLAYMGLLAAAARRDKVALFSRL